MNLVQRVIVLAVVVIVGWQASFVVVPFTTGNQDCNPAVVSMWRPNSRRPNRAELAADEAAHNAANDAALRATATRPASGYGVFDPWGTPTRGYSVNDLFGGAGLGSWSPANVASIFRACPPAAKHRVALHVPIVVLVAAVAGAAFVLFRSRPERQPAT